MSMSKSKIRSSAIIIFSSGEAFLDVETIPTPTKCIHLQVVSVDTT